MRNLPRAGGQFVLLVRPGLLECRSEGVRDRPDRSALELLVPGREVMRVCGAHKSDREAFLHEYTIKQRLTMLASTGLIKFVYV